MIKIIIGLFVGMILAGALFMGPLSPITAMGQSEDSSLTETQADNAETYHKTIGALLQEAGEEIQDKDTARFYQKLIQEYDLDEPSPGMTQVEQSSLTQALPDIKNINQKALILPLQEAGRNIQDEEIAQFYYKFLKDTGWKIESD